jgi:DNA-binding PadR family transcriptional regulator
MAEPTTTSYAILALLAVRSWSAYELAQQMERSLATMWPRATSVVYEEPKRLVGWGLASAEQQYTGKRASTVYSITEAGRLALREWLAEPGGPPSVEHEAMLKTAFADHGSLEGLRANLATIRERAAAELAYSESRSAEYVETGGPFPERLPVIALVARYFAEQNRALLRWAEWAEQATESWTGVTPETGATVPPGAFGDRSD